jgi:hypothetical protein
MNQHRSCSKLFVDCLFLEKKSTVDYWNMRPGNLFSNAKLPIYFCLQYFTLEVELFPGDRGSRELFELNQILPDQE